MNLEEFIEQFYRPESEGIFADRIVFEDGICERKISKEACMKEFFFAEDDKESLRRLRPKREHKRNRDSASVAEGLICYMSSPGYEDGLLPKRRRAKKHSLPLVSRQCCYEASFVPEEKGFSYLLLEWLEKKNLKSVDVYKACNMTKATFSLQLDDSHHPSKNSVLALCIGLQLNEKESRNFLARAGFAFSPADLKDIIVLYYITQKDYRIMELNQALYDHGEKPLP